jgi:hypothetical protein
MFNAHNGESQEPNISEIDCITFGVPPISILPIPSRPPSLFLSFVNEGDPVTLAQPAYIDSLLRAYVLPPGSTDTAWTVPDLLYHPSGDQIGLRDMAADDADHEDPYAFVMDLDTQRSVLFGNPVLHSMALYIRRIEAIRDRSVGLALPTISTADHLEVEDVNLEV